MLKANRLTKTNFPAMAELKLFVIKLKVFILIRILSQGLLGRIVGLISGAQVSLIIGNVKPPGPAT